MVPVSDILKTSCLPPAQPFSFYSVKYLQEKFALKAETKFCWSIVIRSGLHVDVFRRELFSQLTGMSKIKSAQFCTAHQFLSTSQFRIVILVCHFIKREKLCHRQLQVLCIVDRVVSFDHMIDINKNVDKEEQQDICCQLNTMCMCLRYLWT